VTASGIRYIDRADYEPQEAVAQFPRGGHLLRVSLRLGRRGRHVNADASALIQCKYDVSRRIERRGAEAEQRLLAG
jgi:hypothetical protein